MDTLDMRTSYYKRIELPTIKSLDINKSVILFCIMAGGGLT